MVSRLDRLFILLDTGSSESIRLAAAKQLGEVQRAKPKDLNYLLWRIKEYSSKSVWETRVAAGHAIRCILEQVEPWPPTKECLIDDKASIGRHAKANKLIEETVNTEQILEQFDLERTISLCPQLLSLDVTDTEENEPSVAPLTSKGRGRGRKDSTTRGSSRKNDKQEQLMRQRKLINKELGMAMVDSLNIGFKSTDIVSNDDLQTSFELNELSAVATEAFSCLQQDTRVTLRQNVSNYEKVLALLLQEECILESESINRLSESNIPLSTDNNNDTNNSAAGISNNTPQYPPSNTWPLAIIATNYVNDLFNPAWEIRHGAAIALREIVKLQGKSAGKRLDLTECSNEKLNQLWLVDMALKALCVLALDKFGDFLFDQVVAPVRENAAQLLGCCVASMNEANASLTIGLTVKMLNNTNWETRHGGILGLKYCLSVVDKSFSKRLIKECFDPIFKCLGDTNDDVSAEAAASLVPVKDLLIDYIPDKTPKLIKFLWEHLADLDELTTSTSNIVLLLASLITSSSAQLKPDELTKSIPKLWPLLGHSSTSVRISVLKALETLIASQQTSCLSWMPDELMTTALKLIFQRSILESMDEVRNYIERVWLILIRIDDNKERSQVERFNLLRYTSQFLNYWMCLVMQPSNVPIDRGSDFWINIGPDGSRSERKPEGEVYIGSISFNAETINQQKEQITKCRLLGTRLLGALYANLVNSLVDDPESDQSRHSKDTLEYLSNMFIHYIKTKSANQRIISGWAIETWASHQAKLLASDSEKLKLVAPRNLINQLNLALQECSLVYDELASHFTRLQQQTREFVAAATKAEIKLNVAPTQTDKRQIYNLNQIQSFCELNLESELSKLGSKKLAGSSKASNQAGDDDDDDVKKQESYEILSSKKASLVRCLKSTNQSQRSLTTSVLSSLACAQVSWRIMPASLDQVIKPLLDSIETEEEHSLQDKSVNYLVILIELLCQQPEKYGELLERILKRLIDCLSFSLSEESSPNRNTIEKALSTLRKSEIDAQKIIQLDNLQRKSEQNRASSRRQSSVNSSSANLKRSHSMSAAVASSSLELDTERAQEEAGSFNNSSAVDCCTTTTTTVGVRIRGGSTCLSRLTRHFGESLPQRLPLLWNSISKELLEHSDMYKGNSSPSNSSLSSKEAILLKSLKLLEVVGPSVGQNLRANFVSIFEVLINLLHSPNPMIRHQSCQCIGVISKLMFAETIDLIRERIIPMLDLDENVLARCGSIEAIALIIEHLQLDLVPKINMFIIHVLRRMSDQTDQVRLMATHCFGKLLSLMPLNMEQSREEQKQEGDSKATSNGHVAACEEQLFIEQLLNPKKLNNFRIPFEMKAELRSYQQDGLNWLAFMNRYNLHGILCDEMGLGKTFMTICMVSSDHFLRTKKAAEAAAADGVGKACAPSLIVCPSTLTEHWLYEVDKFLSTKISSILNPVAYAGTLSERMALRCRILRARNKDGQPTKLTEEDCDNGDGDCERAEINLIVASYDIVRNDIDFFKSVNWNYCVLDEGHIIKNVKTKLSRAIRLLSAKHRLILSGTPIQNNVTELWSLFDFLMPGFLGSERQFNARYAKPILQSREQKCSSRELEAGALAMESLHRQVLPFILRRLKEDVLADLPPKIIQDYYCELSPLQRRLYEDFTRSKLCKEVTKQSVSELSCRQQEGVKSEHGSSSSEKQQSTATCSNSKSHVFQALQYLKNVCNHPKLVLSERHSQFWEIKKSLEAEKSSLDDIGHSSKLRALKQLLVDCGIGIAGQQTGDQLADLTGQAQQQQQQQSPLTLESVVNQHRALIFCQIRSMVNIIENDLLKRHLPSVTYLKLDGSVPSNQRHSIVSRFNNDPSIDVLLLTTQIGGLGLNLTGADTVIFVEHDWNPTKDLQAMDRAHRIGQRKVVNVYRLITKATLEEKIMGLQNFKTMVSNTVINADNAGLGTMDVDQLLDLFEEPPAAGGPSSTSGGGGGGGGGGQAGSSAAGSSSSSFMELLPELWDQQQYEAEYDLGNFVSSLKNN